jgi:molecular chaperone DnaJ
LSKDASADDIKKAYRKLSKEWHPDKHKGDKGAEDRFKEINQAYETLSDPQKKSAYDQFGSTGNGPGGGPNFGGFDFSGFGNTADFSDIFEGFFGGRQRQKVQEEGANREVRIAIEFMDAVRGAQKMIRLPRLVTCTTCEGSGAEAGAKIITCATCGGTGQVTRTVNSFFGQIQQRMICAQCEGSGKVPEKPCHTCKGSGRIEDTVDVTVDIPAGIDNGQTLSIRGQGDAGLRGAASGDLYVHVRVNPDPRFVREGDDVHSSVRIPVVEAILGGTVEVETVQGSSTVTIPEGTQPGTVLRMRDKGIVRLGTSRHGDHYVTVQVEIPKKLSKAERKVVEEWGELRKEN